MLYCGTDPAADDPGARSNLVFVLAVTLASAAAIAEWSPTRPVRLIMPFAAGTSADAAARVIAQHLSRTWNQPVIGTTIGTLR